MSIRIEMSGLSDDEISFELQQLHEQLLRGGIPNRLETFSHAAPSGQKGFDHNAAIALAGVAIAGVANLINALNFHASQRPGCKITLRIGDVRCEISNLSLDQASALIAKYQQPSDSVAARIDPK